MHFGMTGWIHINSEQTGYTRYIEKTKNDKEEWPPRFWKFNLETTGNPKVEVAFTDSRRFGRVRLVDCPGAEIRKFSPLKENGPDPVVDRDIFTEEYLKQKMQKRHVPIKALLLDQAMISGIGNWVGDEIMFQARLHPEQYSDEFSDDDISKLYKAIVYVCDTAVENLGDSDKFPSDWLFNHRWGKGKKDAATTLPTGEKISFITVGGRTSCIVPSVQKKRGKASTETTKEELDSLADETESKYFGGEKTPKKRSRGKDTGTGKGAKVAPEPAVKATKRRPIKMEEEDEEPVATTTKRVKTKKEETAPPSTGGTNQRGSKPSVEDTPEPGRRRSGRLSAQTT